ncbi:ComEC/Rec2 family competence protein [Dongia sedimenti]|uniref:ComEC/Rec2 family competence protein n=1 Tax=Dongia sedimenti TaxID=3064282 RepID=A0ABU0YK22_9PROT|nr:ComEC/Rec2 family competence protein [Rhodospirillaceae bacterium R-7]
MDWGAIRDRWEIFLAGERANWPGWLAVALGLGIAVYFALPVEPPLWLGGSMTAGGLVLCILFRRTPLVLIVAAALVTAAIGFSAAQVRSWAVAAPQLQDPIRFAHVTGRLAGIEPFPNAIRATLDEVTIAELPAEATPLRLQVKIFKGSDTLKLGDRIDVLAHLQPPSPPVVPGAFDFRRQAYFQRTGATGFALGSARVVAAGEAGAFRLWIDRLRARIGQRIAELEPNSAGAMTRALTVGDQTALSKADTEAMRISGLAHLLSISGLHIGLAAGLFFFGLRGLLALIPPLALHYPIKKWSAAAAILAAGFYALLAGATVPTQRSFVMIAIVFLGVLVDRSPFSFRMVAWAAIAVMLLQPEALTGASFQMSFFAVLGLIAVFEALRPQLTRWRGGRALETDWFGRVSNAVRSAGFWLATTMLTSVVATLMTAPFAMYHFDRISTYGVVANLIAVPLTGFWVMPMGMAALLLMPFGLDGPFWHLAARGCDGILWVAHTVSAWPYAVLVTRAMPIAALVAISLGLVVLCLMRSRARLLGLAPVLGGLATIFFVATPDLLVAGDAKLLAIKDEAGAYQLSSLRASKLAAETWLRRNGQIEAASFPSPDDAGLPFFGCDGAGCVYRRNGKTIALAQTAEALREDCTTADVVVSLVPIRRGCGDVIAIDRFDLWRGGTHALRVEADGKLHIQSVGATLGDRPWVLDRMREGIRAGRLIEDPVDDLENAEEIADQD